jgi:hypothetical protein
LESAEIVETPELLAAIDEGLQSLEKEGGIPIEEVQKRLGTNGICGNPFSAGGPRFG